MWFSGQIPKHKHLQMAISECSREEYLQVATFLCKTMVFHHPVAIGEKILGWIDDSVVLRDLLKEDNLFQFGFRIGKHACQVVLCQTFAIPLR